MPDKFAPLSSFKSFKRLSHSGPTGKHLDKLGGFNEEEGEEGEEQEVEQQHAGTSCMLWLVVTLIVGLGLVGFALSFRSTVMGLLADA